MINYSDYSHIFKDYSWNIINEQESWDFLKTFLRPNCVFFDVGCQKGMYSKAVLQEIDDCFVYAFDVIKHPEINRVCKEYPSNFLFIQEAVSNGNEEEILIHWDSKTSVHVDNTLSLDEFYGLIIPDVIKIDVDCTEYNILIGARKLLTEHNPVIMIELLDEEFEKCKLLLESYGYKLLTSKNNMNYFFTK